MRRSSIPVALIFAGVALIALPALNDFAMSKEEAMLLMEKLPPIPSHRLGMGYQALCVLLGLATLGAAFCYVALDLSERVGLGHAERVQALIESAKQASKPEKPNTL